jgi:hypothetical protein
MIGIFVRYAPNKKWKLFSHTSSAEAATAEMKVAKQLAIKEGFPEAEVAMQFFDTALWIPEYLNKIDQNKSFFN